MARVVPSQVVAFIDKVFPNILKDGAKKDWHLNKVNQTDLAAILDLTDRIPEELLILEQQKYAQYLSSIATIRQYLAIWLGGHEQTLKKTPGYDVNPVNLIREALSDCPDESPAPGTAELEFIDDDALRAQLRLDISSINMALVNGEWKAATVLSGSVSEALLLWRLDQDPEGVAPFVEKFKKPLVGWHLSQYIEAAHSLGVIDKDTATQTSLAKDFRNLIHPGREIRLGQTCNRATALSAVAAVEHVVHNLR